MSVKVETKKMPTTPGVPRRSPIQVLTRPDVAYLPRSNGIGSILRGMVVGKSPALFCLQLDHQPVSYWIHNKLVSGRCREMGLKAGSIQCAPADLLAAMWFTMTVTHLINSPNNWNESESNNKAKRRLVSQSGNEKDAYNTRCSQAVTHPSTNQARRSLSSEIERDREHSTWYGRRQKPCVILPPA